MLEENYRFKVKQAEPVINDIAQGKEMRVSWLWNAKAEEARIEKRYSQQEWTSLYKKVNE